MSGKLDQSLDAIISTGKSTGRGRGRRATGRGTGRPAAAPAGGIKKNTRATRSSGKATTVPTGPAGGSGDSKVIVSNLPTDVSEAHVKEYFHATVGPVKRVQLTYGPNGTSRGIATVVFGRPDGATKALKQLNGVLVDNRPLKIEVVLDASRAPAPPVIKALSERVAQSKQNKPKSAAINKAETNGTTNNATRGRGRGRGGRARGRNAGRGKPKTADELDAEMNDYFDAPATTDAAATTNGATASAAAPAAAAGADAGMEDEIM